MCFIEHATIHTVKILMYGFGDDRNLANDTVSVMEDTVGDCFVWGVARAVGVQIMT